MSTTTQEQIYLPLLSCNNNNNNNNNNNTTTTLLTTNNIISTNNTGNLLKNTFYKNNIIYNNSINNNNNNNINLLNSINNNNQNFQNNLNSNILNNNNHKEENLNTFSSENLDSLKSILSSNSNNNTTNNNNNNNSGNNLQSIISSIQNSINNQNYTNNNNNNNCSDQKSSMSDILLNSSVPDYFEWCAGIINMPNGGSTNVGGSVNNKDINGVDKTLSSSPTNSDSVPSPQQYQSNDTMVPTGNNYYPPPQQQNQQAPQQPTTTNNNTGKPHCSEPTTPTIDEQNNPHHNIHQQQQQVQQQQLSSNQNSSPLIYSVPSYYVPNYGVVLSAPSPMKGNQTILPPQAWTSNNGNNNFVQNESIYGMNFNNNDYGMLNNNNNNGGNNNGMFNTFNVNNNNNNNNNNNGFHNFLQFQNQLQQQPLQQQLQQPIQTTTTTTFSIGKPCNINQKKGRSNSNSNNNNGMPIGNQSSIIISHPGIKMEQTPQQLANAAFLDLSSPESHQQMSPSDNGCGSPNGANHMLLNSIGGVGQMQQQHWESGLDPGSLQKQNELNPPISVRSNVVFFEPFLANEPGRHKACWNLLEPMHRNYYQPIQFKLPSYPDTSLPITQIDEKSGIFDSQRFLAFNNPQAMSKYESYRIYIHPSLGYSGNAKRFKQQPDVNEKALILDGNVYDGHLNAIYNCKICTEYYQTKSYFSANPHAKGKVLLVKNNILTRVKDGGFTLSLKPMCCSGHNSHIPLYFHFTLTNPLTNEVVLQSLINVNVKQWKKSVPNKSKKQRFE